MSDTSPASDYLAPTSADDSVAVAQPNEAKPNVLRVVPLGPVAAE